MNPHRTSASPKYPIKIFLLIKLCNSVNKRKRFCLGQKTLPWRFSAPGPRRNRKRPARSRIQRRSSSHARAKRDDGQGVWGRRPAWHPRRSPTAESAGPPSQRRVPPERGPRAPQPAFPGKSQPHLPQNGADGGGSRRPLARCTARAPPPGVLQGTRRAGCPRRA